MNGLLHAVSDQATGIAIALLIVSAVIVGQRIDDQPSETDALQMSADVSQDLEMLHRAAEGQP